MATTATNGAIKIPAAQWDADVLASDVPVLVDFMADWCPPCRVVGPEVDAVKAELEGTARVFKLDVDAEPEIEARYGVKTIPTLIIFKNGEVVDTLHGAQNRRMLVARVKAQV